MEQKNRLSLIALSVITILVFALYSSQLSYASKQQKSLDNSTENSLEIIEMKLVQQDQFNKRMETKVSNLENLVLGLYDVFNVQKPKDKGQK